jgi:hypothetical protein
VIRNVILTDQETETHAAAGGIMHDIEQKTRHATIGTSSSIHELYTSVHSAIKYGLEWKDTYVAMDTAAESSCFNNPMLFDTLMRRQNPATFQGIGSGVLEAKHYAAFLNKLYVDYIPGIPMNLLSLSQISTETQWQVRYEHEQSECVLRTTAGHKLIFTLYNNFYVCDMATSIFRSHRARVKDAVELFTNSYRTCPAWLLTARLEKIKDTSKVLDIVNTDFSHLETEPVCWKIAFGVPNILMF